MLITNACKEPEEAVRFVDYLYSKEAQDLEAWGLEGEGYNVVGGKRKPSDLITNNPDGLSRTDAISKYTLNDLTTTFLDVDPSDLSPEQNDAYKIWGSSATYENHLPKSLTLTKEETDRF